jgi:DNA-damage-inducible protein D
MPEDIDESQLPQLSAFERIKHRNEDGREWWSARELMLLLTYSKWQDFHKVIQAAIEVYQNSGGEDADAIFMAKRKDSPTARKKYPQLDYELTRHACYLVVLSSDGSKPAVALGKTYFAITTEQYEQLLQAEEDRLRVELREKLKQHHLELSARAHQAGITTSQQYAHFYNAGHRGLYRETASQILARKGLRMGQDFYNYMGSLETAANDFRGTLALTLLNVRSVADVPTANATHYEAGDAVRQTLLQKGIAPEELPTPSKSYQQLVLEQKERQKLLAQYEQGLWEYLGDGQGDQQGEKEQSETVELGVKITIEPVQDDLQFTLAYVDIPVTGAEYTSLSFTRPVSTLIHLYWLPQVPDDRTCAAVMAALDTYLATIIEENEQLNTLYGGKSPFHA